MGIEFSKKSNVFPDLIISDQTSYFCAYLPITVSNILISINDKEVIIQAVLPKRILFETLDHKTRSLKTV